MNRRQKKNLTDLLVVWGFVLSIVVAMGIGCFQGFKYLALVPGAFETLTFTSNPMDRSGDDFQPSPEVRRKMTVRERAQFDANAEQRER